MAWVVVAGAVPVEGSEVAGAVLAVVVPVPVAEPVPTSAVVVPVGVSPVAGSVCVAVAGPVLAPLALTVEPLLSPQPASARVQRVGTRTERMRAQT